MLLRYLTKHIKSLVKVRDKHQGWWLGEGGERLVIYSFFMVWLKENKFFHGFIRNLNGCLVRLERRKEELVCYWLVVYTSWYLLLYRRHWGLWVRGKLFGTVCKEAFVSISANSFFFPVFAQFKLLLNRNNLLLLLWHRIYLALGFLDRELFTGLWLNRSHLNLFLHFFSRRILNMRGRRIGILQQALYTLSYLYLVFYALSFSFIPTTVSLWI